MQKTATTDDLQEDVKNFCNEIGYPELIPIFSKHQIRTMKVVLSLTPDDIEKSLGIHSFGVKRALELEVEERNPKRQKLNPEEKKLQENQIQKPANTSTNNEPKPLASLSYDDIINGSQSVDTSSQVVKQYVVTFQLM